MGEKQRRAPEFVLASSSPRRHQLLHEARFDFHVVAPDIDESASPGEAPVPLALRIAREKASAVARSLDRHAVILAADTMVVLGERILGKPADALEAQAMLLSLSAATHRVLTGYAILRTDDAALLSGFVESRVRMRAVTAAEASAYAAGGEPLDKAGAYAVQGEGGRFVESIEGSRSNVIGLPVATVAVQLAFFGVLPRAASARERADEIAP
jgi:septum formation protein